MNPFKTDASIQQDKVLGEAELIDSKKEISFCLQRAFLKKKNQPTRKTQLNKCTLMIQNTILKVHRKMTALMCLMPLFIVYLPNPDNISKILQWPHPTTVTEVRLLEWKVITEKNL